MLAPIQAHTPILYSAGTTQSDSAIGIGIGIGIAMAWRESWLLRHVQFNYYYIMLNNLQERVCGNRIRGLWGLSPHLMIGQPQLQEIKKLLIQTHTVLQPRLQEIKKLLILLGQERKLHYAIIKRSARDASCTCLNKRFTAQVDNTHHPTGVEATKHFRLACITSSLD
jgi:hypothetical protein